MARDSDLTLSLVKDIPLELNDTLKFADLENFICTNRPPTKHPQTDRLLNFKYNFQIELSTIESYFQQLLPTKSNSTFNDQTTTDQYPVEKKREEEQKDSKRNTSVEIDDAINAVNCLKLRTQRNVPNILQENNVELNETLPVERQPIMCRTVAQNMLHNPVHKIHVTPQPPPHPTSSSSSDHLMLDVEKNLRNLYFPSKR
ncbi:hypothetical protein SNEBB_004951 [Seison nebaliae]|nr:hypothetical protein SNEBB_004951 [Seison nebaliae]